MAASWWSLLLVVIECYSLVASSPVTAAGATAAPATTAAAPPTTAAPSSTAAGPTPVDGGYGAWTYGPCSKTCGPATQPRTRKCDNPVPKHGGKDCSTLGPSAEIAICADNPCPTLTPTGTTRKPQTPKYKLEHSGRCNSVTASKCREMSDLSGHTWMGTEVNSDRPYGCIHYSTREETKVYYNTYFPLHKIVRCSSTYNCLCSGSNPCKPNNGGCDSWCLPYNDTAVCRCYPGYYLADDKKTCKEYFLMKRQGQCTPLSQGECQGMSDTLNNKWKGVKRDGNVPPGCSRFSGEVTYNPNLIGTNLCSDIHECVCAGKDLCKQDNGGCDQTCSLDRTNSVVCHCKAGFVLGADKKSCIFIEYFTTQRSICKPLSSDECQSLSLFFDAGNSMVQSQSSSRPSGCYKQPRSMNDKVLYYNTNLNSNVQCSDTNECVCKGVDPCATNNGGCDHTCSRTRDNSVVCSCKPGYKLASDKKSCTVPTYFLQKRSYCKTVTVADCEQITGLFTASWEKTLLNVGGPQGCIRDLEGKRFYYNTRSTSKAVCTHKKQCVCAGVNPCNSGNGGCAHTCNLNINGTVVCQCREGYVLAGDNKSCEEVTTPAPPQQKKVQSSAKSSTNITWIIVGIGLAIVVIAIIIFVCIKRKREEKGTTVDAPEVVPLQEDSSKK